MKKILFAFFLIGTFVAYAVFVQQSGTNGVNTPVVMDRRQTVPSVATIPPPTQPSVATNPAPSPSPVPPVTALPTSAPVPTNDQLSLQAQGQVLITNTYSVSLTLRKTTRLLTADGKLYHLAQATVVPSGGQVTADVYADQNGSLYAIGPTTFSVPGLSSSLQSYVTVSSNTSFVLAQPVALAAIVPTLPPPTPSPVQSPPPTPVASPPPAQPVGMYKNGTYVGNSVDAYYGNVQVEAIIQGGKIVDVQFLDHPQDRGRSISINDYAMPNLTSEAIQAQSAQVDVVSGATATSGAFVQSLASALAQAKN